MDEGWTRWIVEKSRKCALIFNTIFDIDFKMKKSESKKLTETVESMQNTGKDYIFPDQSPNQILNGYAKGSMPDEYTGGVGKEGVENLRKFVEAGGTLVFLKRRFRFCHRAI